MVANYKEWFDSIAGGKLCPLIQKACVGSDCIMYYEMYPPDTPDVVISCCTKINGKILARRRKVI